MTLTKFETNQFPVIGFWSANQPIVGVCGSVPWDERAWCSYVVLPQHIPSPLRDTTNPFVPVVGRHVGIDRE